jgi:hypothetical protein
VICGGDGVSQPELLVGTSRAEAKSRFLRLNVNISKACGFQACRERAWVYGYQGVPEMEEPKRNTPDAVGADKDSTRLEYPTGLLQKTVL